ncbi:hypothetical protein AaE_001420 [Aphanomyces astaci]|uniref:DDE-1 domain-containing protein n=1 Tax=Aphanomyces astaci TaxID=112090 RepID=A0A6A5AXA6_APHAT|nr:hypothetical protein AaE_001420 [Aphanomyces astaci]
MMRWIRRNQHEWLTTYLNTKKNPSIGYDSLCCLLRRFCTRERLSQRVPCVNKVRQEVLDDVWLGYAAHFWSKYHDVPRSQILNTDETGVFFDMPPGKTYARKGKSSKVGKSCKHSERITVVLTIRADGVKLPMLFIVKGQPGGPIENKELPTYPGPHVYAVQKNAWMDDRVWMMYLEQVLAQNMEDASVLLVDNLECHTSEKAKDKAAEALFSVIEPLPPNSTSRCQPLDVGVMGPLKAMLKSEWLMEEEERETDNMTAEDKRAATIQRTIRVWDRIISSRTVESAFEKSIPTVIEI